MHKQAIIIGEFLKFCSQSANRYPHLGASRGDIANLKGGDVDWTNITATYAREKPRSG